MRFRTRLLVCGFESEQGIGQPYYPEERWWVHVATFSAQGPYSLPWWPVPGDTRKGDLFILRLAPFEVPAGVISELGERQFEFGEGEAGRLAAEAISYTDFGLFGGGLGDKSFELPDHPEFDADRAILGEGVIGLAVAHSGAEPMVESPGLHVASVGTFVPFPDVIGADLLQGRFGGALDDLETPMRDRGADRIEVSPGDQQAFFDFVVKHFDNDGILSDSIFRLKEVASRIGQPMSYFPTGLSPTPRWSFGTGPQQAAPDGAPSTSEDDYTSFSSDGPNVPPVESGPPSTASPALDAEEGSESVIAIEVSRAMNEMTKELMEDLREWSGTERGPDDRPTKLERITAFDGKERRYFEIPQSEAEEKLEDRAVRVLQLQGGLLPLPSVALLVDERELLVMTMLTHEIGGPPEAKVFSADIPQPGEPLEGFVEVPISSEPSGGTADGPYGEEASEIVEHAANDLVGKLRAWAESPRDASDLPHELIMFDGGEVWRHMNLPPTELKRPSLEDRCGEIFPILVDLSPAPTVACFLHRKKLYLLLATCSEPGEMKLDMHRFEVPPPGEPLGAPEEVDISGFNIA